MYISPKCPNHAVPFKNVLVTASYVYACEKRWLIHFGSSFVQQKFRTVASSPSRAEKHLKTPADAVLES